MDVEEFVNGLAEGGMPVADDDPDYCSVHGWHCQHQARCEPSECSQDGTCCVLTAAFRPRSDLKADVRVLLANLLRDKRTRTLMTVIRHRLAEAQDPDGAHVTCYTFNGNRVPVTDSGYDWDLVFHAERGHHGWHVRRGAPDGPVFDHVRRRWVPDRRFRNAGDEAPYERPWDEAVLAAVELCGQALAETRTASTGCANAPASASPFSSC
ncbi:hypothetical protein [Nonomuraea sp. NPDC049400]|uniref:hypothetical protein n=1 Tax=Nonomuraea sp. NPDC049400 TaxID=3364352 RepID=UPI00379F433E